MSFLRSYSKEERGQDLEEMDTILWVGEGNMVPTTAPPPISDDYWSFTVFMGVTLNVTYLYLYNIGSCLVGISFSNMH